MKNAATEKKKSTDLEPLLLNQEEQQKQHDDGSIDTDGEWVNRLLRVGNEDVNVSYPLGQAAKDNTPITSFSISGMPLKLDESAAVHILDASDTQVLPIKGALGSKPGLGIYTIGGTLIMSPPNLKNAGVQFGKLQGMTIMGQWNNAEDDAMQKKSDLGPSDDTLLQAYADDLELEPMPGFKLELKNGRAESALGNRETVMHFSDSELLQGENILSSKLDLKTSREGLKTENGEGVAIDKEQFTSRAAHQGKALFSRNA